MKLLQRLLGYFGLKPKPKDVSDHLTTLAEITDLLKPSSMALISEVFLALYNFQKELPYEFVEDFNWMRKRYIKTSTRSSEGFALFVRDSFRDPHERVAIYYDTFVTSKKELLILDWYSNKESIEEILEHMAVWLQIGIRVHYERYGEGPTGDYDHPVSEVQRAFVFSGLFIKVLSDYIVVLELLLQSQPRGDDFEKLENNRNRS
ncbi:hypothetical protein [Vibrio phage pTD1]|uniref:Uncharacterized protein n=1 Tax=Vibrio phage pTD1 TaxID=1938577 RepID=A0A1Q2U385_9CAUD|nr:hypothetical protein FDH33_gp198 [Vibrio phage pTD1]BAW98407.1 hypothetical protein [Vibrio phage pTD1]